MTNKEFDNYLALVSRMLRLNSGQRDQIGNELRDHLETRVGELVEMGVKPAEATTQALEEFGDATALAQQFQLISLTNKRRWMMRFATLSVAGCFVAAVLIMSMWPSEARFGSPDTVVAQDDVVEASPQNESNDRGPQLSEVTLRQEATLKKLKSSVSLDFDETPFSEVMEQLQADFKINVLLDQSALDDSLSEDEPISFKMVEIPLERSLWLMLREKNATFVVEEGIMRIISLDVANDPEYFSMRIHDARKVITLVEAAEKNRLRKEGDSSGIRIFVSPAGGLQFNKSGGVFAFEPGPQGMGGGGGFGGGGGGVKSGGFGGGGRPGQPLTPEVIAQIQQAAGGNQSPENKKEIEKDEQQVVLKGDIKVFTNFNAVDADHMVVDIIRNTIEPDGWNDTNGDATIEVIGGLLVVTAPIQTQANIERFLQDLESRLSR